MKYFEEEREKTCFEKKDTEQFFALSLSPVEIRAADGGIKMGPPYSSPRANQTVFFLASAMINRPETKTSHSIAKLDSPRRLVLKTLAGARWDEDRNVFDNAGPAEDPS